MNRNTCLSAKYKHTEVYYDGDWWIIYQLSEATSPKLKACLIKPETLAANAKWIDADLLYSNPCELCDKPADGLDQIHCQEHWEQVCSDAYYEAYREAIS